MEHENQNQERREEECRNCRGTGRQHGSYNPHEECVWCEGDGFVPVGTQDD